MSPNESGKNTMIGLGVFSRRVAMGAIAAASLAAGNAYAATPITVVNNLDVPLLLKPSATALEGIEFVHAPPDKIAARSTAIFSIKRIDESNKNEGLTVVYVPKNKSALSIRYIRNDESEVCPAISAGVIETVKDCGKFKSKNWTYTFTDTTP